MPTREQLYTALRNADAAGDVEGARKLAAYIQSLPAEAAAPNKAKQQDQPGMLASLGAGLGKGFGETVLGAQSLVGKGLRNVGADTVGNWLVNDADAGRAKLAAELAPYKEANPVSAGAGEIGGNVIATLPVGGALAGGVRAAAPALARAGVSAPVAEALATAVQTGGFRTGLPAAATLAGRATNAGVRAVGGAVTGGASTALVDSQQAGSGAAIGAVLPGALGVAAKAANYSGNALKSLIQPFTAQGQEAIAAGILGKFGAGGPMAVNAAELVPGSVPTLAEATGNAGIAGLQRSARDLRPNAFVEREAGNAAARSAAFDSIAGDRGAVAAADAARDNAANALYGQAFTADAMRRALTEESQAMRAPFSGVGLSGAPEDLATPGLRELATRPGFKAAIDAAKRLAADKGTHLADPLQSLEGLHYIKLALDDALNPAASSAMGRNASAAVMGMRSKLTDELARVSPLYGNARQTFAAMSQPINAMEALQDLPMRDMRGNITLSNAQRSLKRVEDARAAPGVDPAKAITPEQMNVLASLRDDLLRQDALGAGRPAGSATFQNIATNNILAGLLPGKLGALAEQKAGVIVGQAGRLLYSGPNEGIRNRLVDLLLDPDVAEQALARQRVIAGPSALERLLSSHAVGQPVARVAPVALQDRR